MKYYAPIISFKSTDHYLVKKFTIKINILLNQILPEIAIRYLDSRCRKNPLLSPHSLDELSVTWHKASIENRAKSLKKCIDRMRGKKQVPSKFYS